MDAAKAVFGPDPAIAYIEFDYFRWCPPGYFCVMSTWNDGHVIFHMNGLRPDINLDVAADASGRVTASSPPARAFAILDRQARDAVAPPPKRRRKG